MKNFLLLFCLLLAGCSASKHTTSTPKILMETTWGNILIELYENDAPITSQNFLRYLQENRTSTGSFYRTVTLDNQPYNEMKIEVIQGGLTVDEEDMLPAITHETTKETTILHQDGTLSMARTIPGSATVHFFICIGDQPELDFGGKRNPDGQGFSAFGKVIQGMDIVRKIHQSPKKKQSLEPTIPITHIKIVE